MCELGAGVGIDEDSRQMLDAVADPVIIADVAGVVLYANRACEDLLGWRDGALEGQPIGILQPQRLRDEIVPAFHSFARQQDARLPGAPIRMPMLREDGEEIEVELVACVRDADGAPIVIVTLHGLQERLELERERSLSRYLKATADAAARITSRLDFDYVLATVAETLVDDMGAALAQVSLVAPDSGSLSLYMHAGRAGGDRSQEEIHWSALPVWLGDVMRGDGVCIFQNVASDDRFDSQWVREYGVAWVVALPLMIAQKPRGVMVCAFGGDMWPEVVAVLQTFAAIVATSLNDVQYVVREQEARAEAERAERDFAFLAEASRALASSLDYETTLKTAAHLALPYLADWCVVDIVEGDDRIRRLEVTHASSEKGDLAHMIARSRARLNDRSDVSRVARTGRPLLVSEPTETHLDVALSDREHGHAVRRMGVMSYMCLPLVVRGDVRGVLSLVSSESKRRYTLADLALAEDFARRAAAGMDNAGLYSELQAAMKLRDEFLSTVSHDLKNPIAAIKGRAQMLRRRTDGLQEEESVRFADGLDAIDSISDRMVRLISDLVDVARLRSGAPLELRGASVDLVAIAKRVVEEQQSATQEHVITVRPSVESVVGVWDGDRLERVVGNLVSNAVKYSPLGGDVVIDISLEGEGVRMTVRDHGVGIPADDLTRVFDRFFRASNVGNTIAGSGVGLAGAQQIVQQHKGTMTVQSREGEGTTFSVWLPVQAPVSA